MNTVSISRPLGAAGRGPGIRAAIPNTLSTLLLLAVACFSTKVVADEADAAAHAPLVFTAPMRGAEVAPDPVNTKARGEVMAVLDGERLTLLGQFEGLGSGLRDLAESPANPGVHIHPGERGKTNPYIYGLPVSLSSDGLSGRFSLALELRPEDIALLLAGKLYIDVHTVDHPDGELRSQFVAAQPDQVRREVIRRGIDEVPDPAGVSRPDGSAMTDCH